MKPEKVIKLIQIISVVLAVVVLIYSVITDNFLWGFIIGISLILFSVVVIRMYRTDYLGELDDNK